MTRSARQRPALPVTARSVALQVLLDCHRHTAFAQELLDHQLHQVALSPADRRLTTQLVYGVLRRRGTLDALLQPLIRRPMAQVEIWLWEALRLGAYQLVLLTHIPPHAALNETVELANQIGRDSAKGFLNGVLRALARLITDDRAPVGGADAIPLEDGGFRRLAQPILPDPHDDPLGYLGAAYSLPRWLLERWNDRRGIDECQRLGAWYLRPAPLWLRSNPLRIERAQLLHVLNEAGLAAQPGTHPQSVRLQDSIPVRELPGFAEGWFTVQDETAMQVASALAPTPGMKVLDLCAAPGGKTTHLAELMGNKGSILACDVDDRRLRLIRDLTHRLGISTIQTRRLHPQRGEELPPHSFDAVLVDVPCSNTGVLARRPEARWRLKPTDLPHLVKLQKELLHRACACVRPGGSVLYSTCSIESEENQEVVQSLLAERSDFTLEASAESSPGLPADGGFWARLRRRNPLLVSPPTSHEAAVQV